MSVGAPLPMPEQVNIAPVVPKVAADLVPPPPVHAPARALHRRQAKLSVDGDALDAAPDEPVQAAPQQRAKPPIHDIRHKSVRHEPVRRDTRGAAGSHRAIPRPAPVRSAEPYQIRPTKKARRRAERSRMVRTSQGKVRRGSPQHNLMLSLGGVF